MPGFPDVEFDFEAAPEDAIIGGELSEEDQLKKDRTAAQAYFHTVDEDTALNYIMMLHDMHYISFDELGVYKEMLEKTPKFIPKSILFPKPTKAIWEMP